MSALVFRLRGVPDEEAEEVRALLDEARIDWYETDAGNWGIAMPALWVRDSEDAPRARALIETYARERSSRMRAQWRSRRAAGTLPTLGTRLRERPFAIAAVFAFCLFVLYVSIDPFIRLVTHGR